LLGSMLCGIAALLSCVCALVLMGTAYREKATGKRRWSKIAGDMELVEPGVTYPLECDEIIIGRHASADIRLMDMSVSRYHAIMTVAGGIWRIEDNGSTTGVYINDARVKSARLRENDVVQLGKYRLLFRKKKTKEI